MPTVLIVSSADLSAQLRRTMLWRSDIERVFSPSPELALGAVRALHPKLVLLDGGRTEGNLALLSAIRADPAVRNLSVVVLNRTQALGADPDLTRIATLADEEHLRRAGANVVLSGPVDPFGWDYRLDELLNVPRRREARLDVEFEVWPALTRDSTLQPARALNLSERGLLLETPVPVEVGTQLDLHFTLPGNGHEVRVVGQVVRQAAVAPESSRLGVEFLILRGDARERIRAFIESDG
jgi:CheY-like chemotaxis protein